MPIRTQLLGCFLVFSQVHAMQFFHASLGIVATLIVHKRKFSSFFVYLHSSSGNRATLTKELHELCFVPVLWVVLNIEICEVLLFSILVPLLEQTYRYCFVSNHHAVDPFNCLPCCILEFVMHKSIAVGLSRTIGSHFAGQDIAKQAKGVIQSLVINVRVKIADVDVPSACLAQSGVTLAPHDSARTPSNARIIQRVQSSLSIWNTVEVHIAITQRLARHGISANSDGGHRSDGIEDLIEHRLCDIWM
mmetsp:Transcript_74881/g.165367  ORF Transcript_74881/g.165367 Transcript_74881/m.165367 type:complete len:248 (-) Transcript_74881:135-878(-)